MSADVSIIRTLLAITAIATLAQLGIAADFVATLGPYIAPLHSAGQARARDPHP